MEVSSMKESIINMFPYTFYPFCLSPCKSEKQSRMIAHDLHFKITGIVDVDGNKDNITLKWQGNSLNASFISSVVSLRGSAYLLDVLYKQSDLLGLNRFSQQLFHHPKHWWDAIGVTVLKQEGILIITSFFTRHLPLPGTLPVRSWGKRHEENARPNSNDHTIPQWITSATWPGAARASGPGRWLWSYAASGCKQ